MVTNSSHSSKLFLLAKPFLDFYGILVYHVDVNRQGVGGILELLEQEDFH